MKTIFYVLLETGYTKRPETVIADNSGRHIIVKRDGYNIKITIIVRSGKEGNREETFVFNLANDTTDASPQKIEEIKKILEIRSFDE